MALFCLFCTSLVFAQITTGPSITAPVSKNTVKRTTCLPGYIGCSPVVVKLSLSGNSGIFTLMQTRDIDYPEVGETYDTYMTKINVKIGSNSSTGTYYLPTAIGETVAIAGDGGLGVYNVYIKKTAAREFYLEVSDSNY